MFQDQMETQVVTAVDDSEPYRRLVELQRQMIELVRQHEKTKCECAVLRGQLLEELTRTHRRRSLLQTVQSGVRRLKDLLAFWKSRLVSRPQPNVTLFTRNHLLKI